MIGVKLNNKIMHTSNILDLTSNISWSGGYDQTVTTTGGYVQTVTTNGTELNNWQYQPPKYPYPNWEDEKPKEKTDWDTILKRYIKEQALKPEIKPKENTMKQVFAVAFEVKRDEKNKVISSKEIWTGWVEVKSNSSIDLIVGQAMNKNNVTFDANTLIIKVLHTVIIE